MDVDSLFPFFLLFTPFVFAFIIEAMVIYFFKIKSFWTSIGVAFLINIISVALIYFIAAFILSQIGYELNGLNLHLRVVLFLCWFCIIAEGVMLRLLAKAQDKEKIFTASIIMNILSFSFLYLFIEYSH